MQLKQSTGIATVKSRNTFHIPIENGSLSQFSINHKPVDKYIEKLRQYLGCSATGTSCWLLQTKYPIYWALVFVLFSF